MPRRVRYPLALFVATFCTTSLLQAQRPTVRVEGPPRHRLAEEYTSISGVAELGGGRILVADRSEGRLESLALSGGPPVPVSRNGEGPGEFGMLDRLLRRADGTVLVGDVRQARMHQVNPAGKVLDDLSIPVGDRLTSAVPRAVDAKGRLYFQGNRMIGGPPGTEGDTVPVIRFDPTDQSVTELAYIGTVSSVNATRGAGGAVSFSPRVTPFPSLDGWGVFADGRVAIVRQSPYRLEIINPDGTRRLGPVIEKPRHPVGKAERDAFREQSKGRQRMIIPGNGGPARMAPSPGATVSDDAFPEFLPVFSPHGTLNSPDGELWVRLERPASESRAAYDVFDGTGRLRGTVELPDERALISIGSRLLFLRTVDEETGLQTIEAYDRPTLPAAG